MKDHKKIEKTVHAEGEMPIEDFIGELYKGTQGWQFVTIELNQYYENCELTVMGWVPLTPEEIEKRNAKIKKEREANKRRNQKAKQTRLEKFLREAEALSYDVRSI